MRAHRHPLFLKSYGLLPHRLLNRAVGALCRVRQPQPAVQAAIRLWIRRGRIDMAPFEPRPFATVEDFFLRTLRPGARPIGGGIVAPCDGVLVAHGPIGSDAVLQVKGKPVGLHRLVNGRQHTLDLAQFDGGCQVTVFLTPDGYHHVHAPFAGDLVDVRWIPGRFFPQNDDALRHIPRIYERNERATLRLRPDGHPGQEALLVLVGASLVGGIELEGVARSTWAGPSPHALQRPVAKGDRLGHFSFGSTVVLLLPRGMAGRVLAEVGTPVRMGEPLLAP